MFSDVTAQMELGVDNLRVANAAEALCEWAWTGPMLFSMDCSTFNQVLGVTKNCSTLFKPSISFHIKLGLRLVQTKLFVKANTCK